MIIFKVRTELKDRILKLWCCVFQVDFIETQNKFHVLNSAVNLVVKVSIWQYSPNTIRVSITRSINDIIVFFFLSYFRVLFFVFSFFLIFACFLRVLYFEDVGCLCFWVHIMSDFSLFKLCCCNIEVVISFIFLSF